MCEYWIDENDYTLHTRIHKDSPQPGHHYRKSFKCHLDAQAACLDRIEQKLNEGFRWIVNDKKRVFPVMRLKRELLMKKKEQYAKLNAYKARIASGDVVLPRLRSPQAKRSLVYGRYGLTAPTRGKIEMVFKQHHNTKRKASDMVGAMEPLSKKPRKAPRDRSSPIVAASAPGGAVVMAQSKLMTPQEPSSTPTGDLIDKDRKSVV